LAAALGGILGGALTHEHRIDPATALPLPHHISKYPGGISLRLAMVHDVIHERFPRHGKAYYVERNRLVREALPKEEAKLAEGQVPPEAYWNLVDDLAVGLDRLGHHAEAVEMMRKKLNRQVELGITGKDLYSSYANLGTFLILWQLDDGFADKEKARERVRDSIGWVQQSIQVKPDAHFGREVWQAVLEEFLVASLDDPQLLLRFDMIGDRLDAGVDARNQRVLTDPVGWARGSAQFARSFLKQPEEEAGLLDNRSTYRSGITKVGAEDGWAALKTSQSEPAPFDESALGIIGMWRYGSGANPHFALALGEIMLRVGQRYIAWCAYERAVLVSAGIGSEEIRKAFVEHCRKRQQQIEAQLPPGEVSWIRPQFEKELAFGQRYQQAYQKYEEDRIREGASLDDPTFYDAFQAREGPIASPVGEADFFVTNSTGQLRVSWPVVILFAGIGASLMGVCIRFSTRPRPPSSLPTTEQA
jgi:hypothetical protein